MCRYPSTHPPICLSVHPSQVSAPGGSLEAAVKYMDDKLKGELKEAPEESTLAPDPNPMPNPDP